MPFARCDEERGCIVAQPYLLDVRAAIQQQGDHVTMPFLSRDKERGVAALRRHLLHIRALVQQEGHSVLMPLFSCPVQRSDSILVRRVDVSPFFDGSSGLAEISFVSCRKQGFIHWPHGQDHRYESE